MEGSAFAETRRQDAGARALDGRSWRLWARGLSLTFGFDPETGLALLGFENAEGSRPVDYAPSGCGLLPFEPGGETLWTLESSKAGVCGYGGRPVVRLDVALRSPELSVSFHAAAFPGVPVIRMWHDICNEGAAELPLAVRPLALAFRIDDDRDTYRVEWFRGCTNRYNAFGPCRESIGSSTDIAFRSHMTQDYIPLVTALRENGPRDGFMAAMDFCGDWEFDARRRDGGPVSLAYRVDGKYPLALAPGEAFELPAATLAAFAGAPDDLMKVLFDWQYEYHWDYINTDYYARPRLCGDWIYTPRNLHEQFGFRLANLDMKAAAFKEAGYEILWDDAGWSAYPGWPPDNYGSVFGDHYEGPDFRQSQRYFRKCGIGWLLWFCGKPSRALLEGKQAAWGSFEWRTDGVELSDLRSESAFKRTVRDYLDADPSRSFHTTSGGSRYAHTFDMQRYANYHMLSDGGQGPHYNYYLSYFELPDKWGDLFCYVGERYIRRDGSTLTGQHAWSKAREAGETRAGDVRYIPGYARSKLTMVPMPGPVGSPGDLDACRADLEIYRYLKSKGVAGRWSYAMHPAVFGDREYYYLQRTSKDLRRACVIMSRAPENGVTVYPAGLLPQEEYHVSFHISPASAVRTGEDLIKNGIRMEHAEPGELIYLNLPDHPGSGAETGQPNAPGPALRRIETNLGHTGVGVYWSPGGNGWVSHYEIARDGKTVGRVSAGRYFFDASDGWDIGARYAVRAVGGSGTPGPWRDSTAIAGEPLVYSALGNHADAQGRNGWSAEISEDLETFVPMRWTPPAANPAADLGGTPNQEGGSEGYWEGGVCARAGRGWQQASPNVLCVRTFTVPAAGTVRVTGRAVKEWYHRDHGSDMEACVLHNGRRVWPSRGWARVPLGDTGGAAHDLRLRVEPGDTIRFVVNRSPGGDGDRLPWLENVNLIGWIPRIAYESQMKTAGDTGRNIRISCGSDAAVMDGAGNAWEADRSHSGGRAKRFLLPEDSRMQDAPLFAAARSGKEIRYGIPVEPGLYSVRLRFAETEAEWSGEREMDIGICGAVLDRAFDIAAAARGPRRPIDRIYRCVTPDARGEIGIRLTAVRGEAIVQGIEIAPEPGEPVRVNCGSRTAFVDWAGDVWEADAQAQSGRTVSDGGPVAQASPTLHDAGLYQTGTAGRRVEYRVPAQPGIYSVHLKFAELWLDGLGLRPADISINGVRVRESWDIARAAQSLRTAADLRFEGVSPAGGAIGILIEAAGDNEAVLQAIEIE